MNATQATPPPSDTRDLAELRRLLARRLEPFAARIFLYGSRARGTAGRSSDVDVAVLSDRPLPVGLMSRLREEIEESRIRLVIELVDLAEAGPGLRGRVLREGIPWND